MGRLLSVPRECWDSRRSKENPRHPDFRHKKTKFGPWLNHRQKPGWVDLQLSMMDSKVDGGMGRPPDAVSISVPASGSPAARQVFLDSATCRKLCEYRQLNEAVDALNLLVQRGCRLGTNILYCVLKRCVAEKDLDLGRRIHALSVENGYEGNSFLATHLIGLYASRGKLEEAMGVFSKVTAPSAYMWASIIFAYTRHGEPKQAIRLYLHMLESNVKPDNRIFVAVLKACARAGDIGVGKDVHARIRASAVEPDRFVQTCLVDMYAKCGSLEDAQSVFDRLPQKDVVTWTAMIAGYAQHGMGQKSLSLYGGMQQEGITLPDSVTFVSLLQACASIGVAALYQGKQLHAELEQRGLQADVSVGASLVNMYAKCGSLEDAQTVFVNCPQKNVVTWTAMIAGYVQHGMGYEALSLYCNMQQEGITPPDSVTFVCLLQACASLAALPLGKQLHVQIEERGLTADVVVGNSLITMYAKCGSLQDARRVFDSLPHKNLVTWTAMMAGYSQQGMGEDALRLYSSMLEGGTSRPNSVTFVCLLHACASVAALREGKQLHVQIVQQGLQADVLVGNSLVNMYAKCGSLEDAQIVFDQLSQKDTVTWNAMIAGHVKHRRLEDARQLFDMLSHKDVVTWNVLIAGYAQQGMAQEAFSLYSDMQQEGIIPPNSVTFVCLLQACASVAALLLGKQLHAEIEARGLISEVVVGNSLVNMYAKCGSLVDSQQIFSLLPEKNVVTWNAMIAGHACLGDSEAVFDLLHRMRQDGTEPNGITLLSILSVCSHTGLVDKGRKYFQAMTTDYGVSPTIEHYTCMVDILGRAGHIDEALVIVKAMPFQPNGSVWHTLLGACRKWINVEVGRQAFEFAIRLDDKDAGAYVLMSNIYAGAHLWEEAKEMQAMRMKFGAWKEPGQSWWADMGGVVHSFVVGDRKHPESQGIYARLERLVLKMKKEGYVPHLDSSLRDIPDDEKEAELCGHSEKLAIAYALNKTPEGTTIRIVKNLRVCADCHTATCYISKVEKRTIVCRDASRFHVYKDGICSCGDYW